LLNLLGLNNSAAADTVFYGNYTLCQAIRYVDIVCNQLTNPQALKDQTSQTVSRDMLCRIYIAGSPTTQSTVAANDPSFCPAGCAPTTIYRNFTMPKQIQWIPNAPVGGYLTFQVYDDTGDLLDNAISLAGQGPLGSIGGDTVDWSMSMLVSET